MSVRETIHTTHWARCVLSILAVLSLGACAPQYSQHDWTGLVSKTHVLSFIARASCNTFDGFNPIVADAAFFKVKNLQAIKGAPWTYDIEFVDSEGFHRGRYVIKQIWSAAGITSAPASVTADRPFCHVLAEVPLSRDGLHPYYVEPEGTKTAEYNSLTLFTPLSLLLLSLFCIALCLSFKGFEFAQQWCRSAVILLGMIGVSLATYYVCVETPWHEYQKALSYVKWFDQLPRTASGDLLPISAQQLAYLVAGPKHAQSMQFHFDIFAWIAGTLISSWLFGMVGFVVIGVYWLVTPLPLAQVHGRALREGRPPTADEITAAVLKATVGLSAWKLNVMRRKAEAFTANLRDINSHLYPRGQ